MCDSIDTDMFIYSYVCVIGRIIVTTKSKVLILTMTIAMYGDRTSISL